MESFISCRGVVFGGALRVSLEWQSIRFPENFHSHSQVVIGVMACGKVIVGLGDHTKRSCELVSTEDTVGNSNS